MFLLFIYLLFAMIPCFALLSFVGQRPLATHALNLSPTWSALFFVSHFYFPSKWLPFEVAFLVDSTRNQKSLNLCFLVAAARYLFITNLLPKPTVKMPQKKTTKNTLFGVFFVLKKRAVKKNFESTTSFIHFGPFLKSKLSILGVAPIFRRLFQRFLGI